MINIKITEFKALCLLGEVVRDFERLHFLEIRDKDKNQVQKARILLEKVIENNGYRIAYRTKQPIIRIKYGK